MTDQEILDGLELKSSDGPLATQLAGLLQGPNPYIGTLPSSFRFQVHENRLDDLFVASIRDEGGEVLLQLFSSSRYPTVDVLLTYMAKAVKEVEFVSVREMNLSMASFGYRMFVMATGASRGHINTTTVIADPISEIDAALQLVTDVDTVLSLLDDGADVLRAHTKFGSPYAAAQEIEKIRSDYREIVEYMRAMGAH